MGNLNRLHQIYAKVPTIACKGLCAASCGPIQMSKLEYKRLGEPPAAMTCTLLVEGRCSRYGDRPLICRLFGVAHGMECRWGCEIDGELIDGGPLLREMRLIDPDVRPTYAELTVVLEAYVDELDRAEAIRELPS